MFSIQFIITSLIVVLIPGTGVIYTISTGIVHKRTKSVYAALGCTLGILPHLIACILGLSAIMNMSAQVFGIIKTLGSLYLFYLAIKTWIYAGKSQLIADKENSKISEIVKKGIIINLLNPKLTIFFLSFLPQFIPINTTNSTLSMLVLSLFFMFMTFIVFVLYGLFASFISEMVLKGSSMMKNIERSFAVIFAGLAVDLAISKK
jgi:threonine/homoserine/homoserine lactone efflux protein